MYMCVFMNKVLFNQVISFVKITYRIKFFEWILTFTKYSTTIFMVISHFFALIIFSFQRSSLIYATDPNKKYFNENGKQNPLSAVEAWNGHQIGMPNFVQLLFFSTFSDNTNILSSDESRISKHEMRPLLNNLNSHR